MKELYEKPIAELIRFDVQETIMENDMDLELGDSSSDWGDE